MLSALKAAYRRFQISRTEDALRQLSDTSLALIGIKRGNIPQAVQAIYAEPAQQNADGTEANANSRHSQAA